MSLIDTGVTIAVVGGFILVIYSGFTKRPIKECLIGLRELISGFFKNLDGEE